MSDLVRQRPIWFGGRDWREASRKQFYTWLCVNLTKRLKLAVTDMWEPFLTVTREEAPQAGILYDKTLLQHLGKVTDRVRRKEYAKVADDEKRWFIKEQRYAPLSHWANLKLKGCPAGKLRF